MQHLDIGYRHVLEDAEVALKGGRQEPGRRRFVLASVAAEMARASAGLRRAMSPDALVRPGDVDGFRVARVLRRRLPGMTPGQIADASAELAADAADAIAGAPPVRGYGRSLDFLGRLLESVRADELYAPQTASA